MNAILRLLVLAAFAFVMTFTGCTTMTDDSSVAPGTDEELANLVLQRLTQDAVTGMSTFNVEAQDGVVTLYGSLPDNTIRARAIAIARSTRGVKDVVNKISRW